MDPHIWNSKSKEVKDLIAQMLDLNIETRISSQDILKHEWFQHDNEVDHSEAHETNDVFFRNFTKLND